jgi:hypothetical protein
MSTGSDVASAEPVGLPFVPKVPVCAYILALTVPVAR